MAHQEVMSMILLDRLSFCFVKTSPSIQSHSTQYSSPFRFGMNLENNVVFSFSNEWYINQSHKKSNALTWAVCEISDCQLVGSALPGFALISCWSSGFMLMGALRLHLKVREAEGGRRYQNRFPGTANICWLKLTVFPGFPRDYFLLLCLSVCLHNAGSDCFISHDEEQMDFLQNVNSTLKSWFLKSQRHVRHFE